MVIQTRINYLKANQPHLRTLSTVNQVSFVESSKQIAPCWNERIWRKIPAVYRPRFNRQTFPHSNDLGEDGRANIPRGWLRRVRPYVVDFGSYRNLPRLYGRQTANNERIPTRKPEHEDRTDCDFVVGFLLVCHHATRRAERDLHLWRTIHRPSFVLFWLDGDGRDNLRANIPSAETDQRTRSK